MQRNGSESKTDPPSPPTSDPTLVGLISICCLQKASPCTCRPYNGCEQILFRICKGNLTSTLVRRAGHGLILEPRHHMHVFTYVHRLCYK